MCLRKSFPHLGNEDILKDLLEAVLDISIKNVTVKNPELPVNLYDSKAGILDINVEIDDNTICDIEMQVSNLGNFDKRATYYMSRIFSENLKSSEDYSKLKKAIVINFLDFELYKRNSYHSIAHMKFENTKEIEFVDMGYSNDEQFAVHDLEMHFIEIPKFVKKNPNTDAKLEQWLWLLAGREDKLEMAKKKNKQIQSAIDLVKRMSMSEKEWYLYRSRQMAIMDYNVGMNNARKEGENIGLQEGKSIGLQEGKTIGLKEGQKKKQLEIAKKMLEKSIDIKTIIELTGLTEEEIKQITI